MVNVVPTWEPPAAVLRSRCQVDDPTRVIHVRFLPECRSRLTFQYQEDTVGKAKDLVRYELRLQAISLAHINVAFE